MEQTRHVWRERRAATLKDVAREVGVSESLVSFVLNGSSSGTRVSVATRERVVEAAERMGYRRNAIARSLNTGRSNRLGVYSGRSRLDSRNVYFAEILGGMFEGARDHAVNVVVHTSGEGSDQLLDLVSDRTLDGLVVFGTAQDPILPVLNERRIPTIALGDRIEGVPSICVDDHTGGFLQAKHLAERGHRNILVKLANPAPYSGRIRTQSLYVHAQELGICVTVRDENSEVPVGLLDEEIEMVTRTQDRVTAVVGWNDITAEAICETLDHAGLKIPEDVAVMGFDGFARPFVNRFALSTIQAPWAEVGKLAAHQLVQMLEGQSVPLVTVLPVRLKVGATT